MLRTRCGVCYSCSLDKDCGQCKVCTGADKATGKHCVRQVSFTIDTIFPSL